MCRSAWRPPASWKRLPVGAAAQKGHAVRAALLVNGADDGGPKGTRQSCAGDQHGSRHGSSRRRQSRGGLDLVGRTREAPERAAQQAPQPAAVAYRTQVDPLLPPGQRDHRGSGPTSRGVGPGLARRECTGLGERGRFDRRDELARNPEDPRAAPELLEAGARLPCRVRTQVRPRPERGRRHRAGEALRRRGVGPGTRRFTAWIRGLRARASVRSVSVAPRSRTPRPACAIRRIEYPHRPPWTSSIAAAWRS
jgi:hypothetical protein